MYNLKEFSEHFNINEDVVYQKLALLFFVIWLLFKGVIRNLIDTESIAINTFLGFVPNLFAGVTLVFWQIYVTSSKPFLTWVCVNAVLFCAEFIQLFIPTQTADVLDLCANIFGSTVAVIVVILREKRKSSKDQDIS